MNEQIFKEWGEYNLNRELVKQSAEDLLNSKDPKRKGIARNNLEELINQIQRGRIKASDSNETLFQYAPSVQDAFESAAHNRFKESPNDYLDYSYSKFADNFKKNYHLIDPFVIKKDGDDKKKIENVKTGNNEFDKAIDYHIIASRLGKLIEARDSILSIREKRSEEKNILEQHLINTSALIERELYLHLVNELKLSEEEAKKVGRVFAQMYVRSPEHIDEIVKNAINRSYHNLEKIIPEENRGKYAKAILKAKINAGEENYADASKELYKIIS